MDDIPNGLHGHIIDADGDHLNGPVDSKLGSPKHSTDCPLVDAEGAEQKMKIEIPTTNGITDSSITASIKNAMSSSSFSAVMSPETFNVDPMLASALLSPMHDLDLEKAFSNAAVPKGPSVDAAQAANDWELYKRAGPQVPLSFDRFLMNHHQKNSNSWQLAHDLGAGSGVYAPNLARYFRHIHVSDPEASGIATSRKLLSAWSAENPKRRGRFTFSTTQTEQSHESFTGGSVDLAIIVDSAHFTDVEATVRSVAQTLTPNGTLAIITHRPVAVVVGNERVNAAVQRLFDAWGRRPWDVACGTSGRGPQQFSLGLDFVPLPADLFMQEKTRRILINTRDMGREVFRVPGLDSDKFSFEEEGMEVTVSRADEKERRVVYTENDAQGRGWRQQVGWESFRTRVAMLEKGNRAVLARLEPCFQEIQKAIEETSPNGVHVTIEWSIAVVLATRRKE